MAVFIAGSPSVWGGFSFGKFFDLTNVSVQVILFPLNLVLRASLTFLTWKVKEASDNVDSIDSHFVRHI